MLHINSEPALTMGGKIAIVELPPTKLPLLVGTLTVSIQLMAIWSFFIFLNTELKYFSKQLQICRNTQTVRYHVFDKRDPKKLSCSKTFYIGSQNQCGKLLNHHTADGVQVPLHHQPFTVGIAGVKIIVASSNLFSSTDLIRSRQKNSRKDRRSGYLNSKIRCQKIFKKIYK